jgi:hypothetical protein
MMAFTVGQVGLRLRAFGNKGQRERGGKTIKIFGAVCALAGSGNSFLYFLNGLP